MSETGSTFETKNENHQRPNYFRVQWQLLGAAIFFFATLSVYQQYKARNTITTQEQNQLLTQSRVISRNIERQLEAADLTLQSIIHDLPLLSQTRGKPARINQRLKALSDAMPGVRTLLILDAAGMVIASDRNELFGKNFSTRDYFNVPHLLQDNALLYVSPPIKSVLGVVILNLSRVIPGPNNRFDGVVVASLDPEYFEVLLSSVRYASDMTCAITHGDGLLFMSVPILERTILQNQAVSGSFYSRHLVSKKQENILTGISASFGEENMMAIQTVQPASLQMNKPLYVFVSRKLDAIYADWFRQLPGNIVFFVLFILVATTGLYLLQKRQQILEKKQQQSQELMRLRLHLLEIAMQYDMQVLLRLALDEVCGICCSPIGFYHFVEPDQQTLSLQVWSTRTLKEFCTAEGHGLHYPIENAGVWADSVRQKRPIIHNDYASIPNRKGTPEGHAPVIRELVTPILRSGQVVAILGVGNKPDDYTEQDTELVNYLADVMWEITERKRAEEALNASEQRFRTVANYTFDWEYWISSDGTIRYMTPSCERVTGYTSDEFVADPSLLLAIIYPGDAENFSRHIDCLCKGEEAHQTDFRILTKNGDTKWIAHSCQAAYDSQGNYCGRRASNSDISDRKKLESSLRNLSQRLTDIFEFLPDATFVIDLDKRVIAWNKAMEKMSGVPKNEIIGQGNHAYTIPFYGERRNQLLDLIDVDNDQLKAKYSHVTRVDGTLYAETFCPALYNGKGAHVWAIVAPLYDGNGNCIGAIESIRDISAIKEVEANLSRSNQELEQFAYVASHDLQEPLRKIAGFTELLENRLKGSLDEKSETYMGYIIDGATRMHTLINDLLSYSRVTRSGRQHAPVNSTEVLDLVLRDMAVTISENNAIITIGELPVILGDKTQLGQLFQNLISNAIKYQGTASPKISITAHAQSDTWLFAVADNGIGIAPEFFERIFMIFQRLHTRTEYPGTGIGLAICQKIVERHGGKIWVASDVGKGTTFYFTIPKTLDIVENNP